MNDLTKLVLLVLLLSGCHRAAEEAQGELLIIGGGVGAPVIMDHIVELAGGPTGHIVVLPQASGDPLEAGKYMQEKFVSHGIATAEYLLFDSSSVDERKNIEAIDRATGIYFGGGDQALLQKALLGSKLLDKITNFYEQGGFISGNSAGAAVMSALMITGNEHKNTDEDRPFSTVAPGNIELLEGFGYITEGIIDQHHLKRRRNNRVLSVVLEHPDLLGIAIDERTAIHVAADRTFEVIGEGTVVIYDARCASDIRTDSHDNFAVDGLKLSILKAGDHFSMISGRRIK